MSAVLTLNRFPRGNSKSLLRIPIGAITRPEIIVMSHFMWTDESDSFLRRGILLSVILTRKKRVSNVRLSQFFEN